MLSWSWPDQCIRGREIKVIDLIIWRQACVWNGSLWSMKLPKPGRFTFFRLARTAKSVSLLHSGSYDLENSFFKSNVPVSWTSEPYLPISKLKKPQPMLTKFCLAMSINVIPLSLDYSKIWLSGDIVVSPLNFSLLSILLCPIVLPSEWSNMPCCPSHIPCVHLQLRLH